MKSESEVSKAIELYGDTVFRLAAIRLNNHADAEDIFQTVFLKYTLHSPAFINNEHEKAWLIRVTVNACKDLQKSFFYSKTVDLESIIETAAPKKSEDYYLLKAVMDLPQKYRDVIYLHFYEDYTAPEIGEILKKNTNTVYTLIRRATKLLYSSLGGDGSEQ